MQSPSEAIKEIAHPYRRKGDLLGKRRFHTNCKFKDIK